MLGGVGSDRGFPPGSPPARWGDAAAQGVHWEGSCLHGDEWQCRIGMGTPGSHLHGDGSHLHQGCAWLRLGLHQRRVCTGMGHTCTGVVFAQGRGSFAPVSCLHRDGDICTSVPFAPGTHLHVIVFAQGRVAFVPGLCLMGTVPLAWGRCRLHENGHITTGRATFARG